MIKNSSCDIESLPLLEEKIFGGMKLDVENNLDLYNRMEKPIVLKPGQATFEDIIIHARLRQRLSDGTITRNIRYLKFMETHIQPVNLMNPSYENFLRHMDYREQIEHAGWGALKHEYQAIIMLLRCYGIDPKTWYYKPPQRQQKMMITIPYPDQVHQMIHQRYSKDGYTDALIRYVLTHDFIVGWRPMSEVCIAKVSDVDLDNETLLITSPKLHNATRIINIHEICNQHDNPSMRNWLEHWRNKVENQYSKDYLYLHPNGRPFENADQLRQFINRNIKKAQGTTIPAGYYNYLSRHWCAIARLIRTKIKTKKYDEYEVMEHLGHTKIETTIGYIRSAKFYYEQTQFDWLSSILTGKRKVSGDNAIQPTEATKKSSNQINRYGMIRRPPNLYILLSIVKIRQSTGFLFCYFFFFSFFVEIPILDLSDDGTEINRCLEGPGWSCGLQFFSVTGVWGDAGLVMSSDVLFASSPPLLSYNSSLSVTEFFIDHASGGMVGAWLVIKDCSSPLSSMLPFPPISSLSVTRFLCSQQSADLKFFDCWLMGRWVTGSLRIPHIAVPSSPSGVESSFLSMVLFCADDGADRGFFVFHNVLPPLITESMNPWSLQSTAMLLNSGSVPESGVSSSERMHPRRSNSGQVRALEYKGGMGI